MPALITGLAYRLGRLTPLTDLIGPSLPAEVAEQLLARGQRMCPVADRELPLITESVAASLDLADVDPASVDRVFLTSESILIAGSKRGHEATRARLYSALAGLGLGQAPVVMMTFAGCSSAVAALEYATCLVERETAANVLIVAADRVLEGHERVLPPAVSIVGDGVASCVVTSQRNTAEGLALRWVRRRAFLAVANHDRATDFGPALVMLGRSLGALGKQARAASGDLDRARLVCNNYGLPTIRLFGRTLGIADERVFIDNVSRIGHLGSPDPLVNLATLTDYPDGVAVLATGPADCALAFLAQTKQGAPR
jgi:3-oxoacyl-[acyl-carrier-protein] synthase-3